MREGPIVVGVDGTAESFKALSEMVELVTEKRAAGGLDLVVVFVRSPGWTGGVSAMAQGELINALDEAQAVVERDVKVALEGVNLTWRFVVRQGDPAHELIQEAEAQEAAGIAVGGHRHSTIGGMLLHSVESRLVHTYDGSLLIVREGASSPAS
jgi:nucleotide-binding universal stress UspA family protein